MRNTLLLVVDDHFDVPGRGVIVMPALPVRRDERYPFTAEVDVVKPGGERLTAVALFTVPMGVRAPHACVVLLRDLTKDQVEIGFRIFADAETVARARGPEGE
jgi:hypothetical protein